eukprot:3806484-Pleurochrysis_carterae.AAC.2
MKKLYLQLQRRLLPVLLPKMARSPILHDRGNQHHVQRSCRSDTSDRVVGDIPYNSPAAYIAVHARQWPILGVIRVK